MKIKLYFCPNIEVCIYQFHPHWFFFPYQNNDDVSHYITMDKRACSLKWNPKVNTDKRLKLLKTNILLLSVFRDIFTPTINT